jgi:hypothetical protein
VWEVGTGRDDVPVSIVASMGDDVDRREPISEVVCAPKGDVVSISDVNIVSVSEVMVASVSEVKVINSVSEVDAASNGTVPSEGVSDSVVFAAVERGIEVVGTLGEVSVISSASFLVF